MENTRLNLVDNRFEVLSDEELSNMNGGVAPLLIVGGMLLGAGGGFGLGYGLSRWLG